MTTPPFPTGPLLPLSDSPACHDADEAHRRYQHAHLPHHTNETCPPCCASPHPMPPQRLNKKEGLVCSQYVRESPVSSGFSLALHCTTNFK
ncbi:uncharacterized [Tachysurus ichikawai]